MTNYVPKKGLDNIMYGFAKGIDSDGKPVENLASHVEALFNSIGGRQDIRVGRSGKEYWLYLKLPTGVVKSDRVPVPKNKGKNLQRVTFSLRQEGVPAIS